MSAGPPIRRTDDAPRDARVAYAGGTVTVTVEAASLGNSEAPSIAAKVIEILDARGRSVRGLVFDLSNVVFMNSTGLGMVIDLRNRALAVGASTFAFGLNSDVREIFRVMKDQREVARRMR
jgi:anti-anti-sigma factor